MEPVAVWARAGCITCAPFLALLLNTCERPPVSFGVQDFVRMPKTNPMIHNSPSKLTASQNDDAMAHKTKTQREMFRCFVHFFFILSLFPWYHFSYQKALTQSSQSVNPQPHHRSYRSLNGSCTMSKPASRLQSLIQHLARVIAFLQTYYLTYSHLQPVSQIN